MYVWGIQIQIQVHIFTLILIFNFFPTPEIYMNYELKYRPVGSSTVQYMYI